MIERRLRTTNPILAMLSFGSYSDDYWNSEDIFLRLLRFLVDDISERHHHFRKPVRLLDEMSHT